MFWKIPKFTKPSGNTHSLAFLLTGWYTSASLLIVAAATSLFYFALANNLRKISEQLLTDEVDVCQALVIEHAGESHALREEVEIDSAVRRYQKFFVRVLDADGQLLSATPGMDANLSQARFAEAGGRNSGIFRVDGSNGERYRAVVSTVSPVAGEPARWTLQVAVDLAQEQVVLSGERIWVWTLLGASLLICPAVGYAIAHRGTRPLREVAEAARHIGSSTLDGRIRFDAYPTEIRTVVIAFNAMLERLEAAFSRLSRFSADIAHELRTPVNNIRGESEVALARSRSPEQYREALASCLEESVRLTGLIESLLFLARAESPGDHLKRDHEDLSHLLTDLRDYYDAAASEQGVLLEISAEDPSHLRAHVDRVLLQRALDNLIANSLAHCSPGDTVSLSAEREDGHVRIQIRDTGAGISPESLPRVFDRLYRGDPARSRNSGGSGLGLAIVRQIVLLHGGDVQIASTLGQGTTVSVTLPDS